jgi:DUF4097 and DUF4098 domain-containing protein YvlB
MSSVQTFDTPGRVSLEVTVPAGEVTIRTWAEPRVEVEVTPSRGDEASQQAASETRIEAIERGGGHHVVVRAPKREGRFGFLDRKPSLDVAVRCPEGADFELTTHSADLDVRGPLGDVDVKSASGDAMLGDTESLSFQTASGDLSAGDVSGSLNAKSASGDVSVRAVGGAASVGSVSGDVRIVETREMATVNTVSGDVELEAVAGGARVSAVSGDVQVWTRPGLSIWLDVQSVSGSVSSELDVDDAPAGDGETVELRVRTVSGDVEISRAAPAAA